MRDFAGSVEDLPHVTRCHERIKIWFGKFVATRTLALKQQPVQDIPRVEYPVIVAITRTLVKRVRKMNAHIFALLEHGVNLCFSQS